MRTARGECVSSVSEHATVTVPHLLSVPLLFATSDLAATVPKLIGERFPSFSYHPPPVLIVARISMLKYRAGQRDSILVGVVGHHVLLHWHVKATAIADGAAFYCRTKGRAGLSHRAHCLPSSAVPWRSAPSLEAGRDCASGPTLALGSLFTAAAERIRRDEIAEGLDTRRGRDCPTR